MPRRKLLPKMTAYCTMQEVTQAFFKQGRTPIP